MALIYCGLNGLDIGVQQKPPQFTTISVLHLPHVVALLEHQFVASVKHPFTLSHFDISLISNKPQGNAVGPGGAGYEYVGR